MNWEPADSKGLIRAVKELLDEYKLYQLSILRHIPRMQFEYTSLLDVLEASKVEVYVTHRSEVNYSCILYIYDFKTVMNKQHFI